MKFFGNLLFSTIVTSCLAILFLSAVALAQVAGSPPPVAPPSLGDLLSQATGVYSAWKAGGALVGLAAIVNLLVNLTKYPAIDKLLGSKFWLRPLISVAFAVITGIIGALTTGVPVLTGIILGVLAGITIVVMAISIWRLYRKAIF